MVSYPILIKRNCPRIYSGAFSFYTLQSNVIALTNFERNKTWKKLNKAMPYKGVTQPKLNKGQLPVPKNIT